MDEGRSSVTTMEINKYGSAETMVFKRNIPSAITHRPGRLIRAQGTRQKAQRLPGNSNRN